MRRHRYPVRGSNMKAAHTVSTLNPLRRTPMTTLTEREAGKCHFALCPGRFWWTVITAIHMNKLKLILSWQNKFLKNVNSLKRS